jgi:hypothetical protein
MIRDRARRCERSEVLKDFSRRVERWSRGRRDPSKGRRIVNSPRGEVKERWGKIGAQNLRLPIWPSRKVLLLAPQSNADTWRRSSRATRALVSRVARDRLGG